jgi:mycothiol synthase
MPDTRVEHPVAPSDLAAIRHLHHRAEAVDGHASLNEGVWRDLESGGQPGSAGVYLCDGAREGSLVGYAHVAPSDSFSPPHWAAGVVVDPGRPRPSVLARLLPGVVDHVARAGGGEIVLWLVDPSAADDEAARAVGFTPSRELLQMRVALPLSAEASFPPGTEVRPFVPGRDEAAWLAVNNRAFRNHPEQGGWVEATLERRKRDPWFDPAGFLLAWDAEGLAGFCWTKIHPAGTDAAGLGEIFVIGVDPGRQGTGLGRALVLAGLDSLWSQGVPEALLYVDGANAAAVGLYADLGFTVHRRDRAYSVDTAPPDTGPPDTGTDTGAPRSATMGP